MSTYFPDKKTFLKLAKKGNLVPVYREFLADLETPVSCFMKIGGSPYSFLLESVEGGERMARYSFIGSSASLVFASRGRKIRLITPGAGPEKEYETAGDSLRELEKLMKRYRQVAVEGLPPFSGGAVGFIGYDFVRFIEKIPDRNKPIVDMPDSTFIFTDTLFIFDHLNKKIKAVSNVLLDRFKTAAEAYDHAVEKIETEIRRLRVGHAERMLSSARPKGSFALKPCLKKSEFEKAVRRGKEYIRKGDIIQVVLSQAFTAKVHSEPFDVYRALRSINPSPYMFYFDFDGFQMVGSSPEVHVRCEDQKAMLRPIAGTRPRGADAERDARLQKQLLADPKERAEHVMLVDLGRNDLGRVCEYHSVKVPELMTVERYSHVMHIVSLVEGKLRKGKTLYDLLRATFPAGTISGAPKVRAMEIIDELEKHRRMFYSGIVGYFSFSGSLNSCITIRTMVIKDGTAYLQAGAGIVADSNPAKEYQETINKAKALVKAIQLAEEGIGT